MRVRIVASMIVALVVAGSQPAVAECAWVLWNRHQSRATDGKEREDWRLIDAYATVEECRRHRTRVIDDIWRSAEETQKLPGVIEVKIAVIETGIRTETLYEKPDTSRRDVNYFICRPEDASPTPLDP